MFPLNSYGSYLIRESESHRTLGCYALSVRDRDLVQHYKIFQSVNHEFYITEHCKFKTLQDLVAHYRWQADGLCVNLRKPCVITTIDAYGPKPDDSEWETDRPEPDDSEWETDRSGITLVKNLELMSNSLTEVWKGIWNKTTLVAVKTLKPNQNNMTVDEFLESANLMKKLRHPQLVQLYALCSKEEPVIIITELMKHGSLLNYLRDKGKLKLCQLIHMAEQVSSGMTYLEKQNVIHRNLSANNIQVGKDLLCKVANFELARIVDRDIYEGQEKEKIAIKWMAPEATLHYRFSVKSDVWSFGIVLYEIITCGRTPYPDMANAEVKHQIQQGYRMPQPLNCECPDKLYGIMLNCWQVEPVNRPTFDTLQQELLNFFEPD